MPPSLYGDADYFLPAAPVASPSRRRTFLAGLAATGTVLAAAVSLAPDWDDAVPNRPARAAAATRAEAPAVPMPPPAVVAYGPEMRAEWQAFRHRFVTPEGRVLDTGNNNQSHSEGQGWALMASQAADDAETFATVLEWTTTNLRRRGGDHLHAWRYKPGEANPVSDLNNATDGDLFIAAALARAALRWNRPDYAARAAAIGRDILSLVRRAGSRTVLLPGAVGFENGDSYTVNPSYYAFALFPDLAALVPSPLWQALREDGLALILQARYGRWQLPPDWVRVARADGALSIAPGWPPRFSWDAIRVPLHLAWAGLSTAPLGAAFREYWTTPRAQLPAWVDLRTDAVAPYAANTGISAVFAVATRPQNLSQTPHLPSVMSANDYYSAGLVLLSHMAVREGRAVG